jgi:hypothetical protein
MLQQQQHSWVGWQQQLGLLLLLRSLWHWQQLQAAGRLCQASMH